MYSEMSCIASWRVAYRRWWIRSRLRVPKKLSAQALSQQWPRSDMLAVMPCVASS